MWSLSRSRGDTVSVSSEYSHEVAATTPIGWTLDFLPVFSKPLVLQLPPPAKASTKNTTSLVLLRFQERAQHRREVIDILCEGDLLQERGNLFERPSGGAAVLSDWVVAPPRALY